MRNHGCVPLLVTAAALFALAGCGGVGEEGEEASAGGRKVQTTGKQDTTLESVPADVLKAARAARPGLEIAAAEHEVRDGREYYDLGGTLPDGSELELDLTRAEGAWTVVEIQRDISLEAVPGDVRAALAAAQPDWQPTRIIESDQGDGVIIYEFFGSGPDGAELKREVKWAGGVARLLEDEWLH